MKEIIFLIAPAWIVMIHRVFIIMGLLSNAHMPGEYTKQKFAFSIRSDWLRNLIPELKATILFLQIIA